MKLKIAKRIINRNKAKRVKAEFELEKDRTPKQVQLLKKIKAAERVVDYEKARKNRANN